MPSLYVGHVKSKAPMRQIDIPTDYLTYFRTFHPLQVAAATDKDDKDHKKQYVLNGAVGGEMIPNSGHGDHNTLGRDVLPLDFDRIVDEGKFLDAVAGKLDPRRIGYVLYKTFSYRPNNVRYRLLVPLDRMVTRRAEYQALMNALARALGAELDKASTPWGQVFFLPVQTEYNATDLIRVHDGDPLIISNQLKAVLMNHDDTAATLTKPTATYQAPRHKTPLGFSLDRIAQGTAKKSDYKDVSRFFTNIGMTEAEKFRWLDYFDSIQVTPPDRGDPIGIVDVRFRKRKYWADMLTTMIDGADEGETVGYTQTGDKRMARNYTMFNFVSFLTDQHVEAATITQFANDLNDRNRPPLPPHELNGIFLSVMKRMEVKNNANTNGLASSRPTRR